MNTFYAKQLKAAVAIFALFGLAACGGGGGGGDVPPSTQQTATATLQTGTIAVSSAEMGTSVAVSSDSAGQRVLTVENAGTKLANAQAGQVMVFEASSAMPLGFAGIVQSVQTSNVGGVPTTTATFVPAGIGNVFHDLNLSLSNVGTNPQLMAGVAMQRGVHAYTRTEPQSAGRMLNAIRNELIDLNVIAKNTNTAVGVDFSGGIKASFWKVNGTWVATDPGTSAPRVDIVFTGQIELQNPNFSHLNIVIEDGKLVTHNLQLQGTLKRNIKATVTGDFAANASDMGGLFSNATSGFYSGNGGYNEYSFDYKGSSIKIHGVEKDPSKIILGAAVISAVGVVPTYGTAQTGAVLKTVPVGMVVTFFMTADMQVEATASLGYEWRDMDINAGMGVSYDDSLGLPVSLLTGNTKPPVPFWDATAHLDQAEGVSYDVAGSATALLTVGVDGGIVLTGLEIAQATVEGGIRGSLSGQFSKPAAQAEPIGCYTSASVTAGVRALLDVAAGVDLQTNFTSKWLKWLNASVSAGYVYEFPMYPAAGVDWLGETTIWSVGNDTCHNPQFSAAGGTALYSYNFDASATGYGPIASSFTWDFGDSATGSGVTAEHTYAASGDYTATLTVLFSDGIQKTVSKTITVAAVPALAPAFTVGFDGLQASFDASTSTPSGSITGYSWSFGDGATGDGVTASHAYTAYSDTPWSVTLTVTDSYGRTASVSQNVSASCPSGQVLQNGECVAPIAAPTGVSATAGDGQASISWNTVSGASSYNLYMASATGVTKSNYGSLAGGAKITGVTSPFIQPSLTNGTPYYFKVTAVDANGESTESSEVSATPQGSGVPPYTVTIFSAGISTSASTVVITSGPDGNLWFTENDFIHGGRIGRITPSGVVTEFSAVSSADTLPDAITTGADGNLWFTIYGIGGNQTDRIGRITPAGVVTEFGAGISAGAQIHDITAGPDGNLWFTENGGARIGRITPSGVVTEFSVGISPGAGPHRIVTGPDGNLWFTEPGVSRIGRITPAGVVTEFSTGFAAFLDPIGITAGPDGNLWFTVSSGIMAGRIGRITPAGVVTQFSAGSSAGQLGDIMVGSDGNLWFKENGTDRIFRITPSGVLTEVHIGTSYKDITSGPDGNLWFTQSGNSLGRMTLQ